MRLLSAIRLGAWAFSFFGFYLFLYSKRRTPALIPATIVGGITVVIFIAGLLNVLTATAYILLGTGVCLFVYYIWLSITKRFCITAVLRDYSLWFFSAVALFMLWALNDAMLIAYDDFSHWGTVVRCLLANNRLPRYSDTYIMFQSYPTGTAGFIYFFSSIVGDGEGGYLFAQFFMSLSLWVSLLSASKKRPIMNVLLSVLILCFSIYNVSIRCLSVDTVLAACGTAAVIMILCYRDSLRSHLPDILALLCACVTIKNSGIFFYTVAFALLLSLSLERHSVKTNARTIIISFILPLLLVLIWRQHVDFAFDSGMHSKHALSMANASGIIGYKSSAEITEEFGLILSWICDPRKNPILLILPVFPLLHVFRRRTGLETESPSGMFCGFVFGASVLYEIGIIGMYILSMPHDELLFQNGADYLRYNGTFVSFLSALLAVYAVASLQQLPSETFSARALVRWKTIVTICIVGVIATGLYPRLNWSDCRPSNLVNEGENYQLRTEVEEIVARHPTGDGRPILIRFSGQMQGQSYCNYMLRYLTLSTDYSCIAGITDEEFQSLIEQAYYSLYIDSTTGQTYETTP